MLAEIRQHAPHVEASAQSCAADYMTERLGFPSEGIATACAELYSRFGTTLAGLVVRLLRALTHGTTAVEATHQRTPEIVTRQRAESRRAMDQLISCMSATRPLWRLLMMSPTGHLFPADDPPKHRRSCWL